MAAAARCVGATTSTSRPSMPSAPSMPSMSSCRRTGLWLLRDRRVAAKPAWNQGGRDPFPAISEPLA